MAQFDLQDFRTFPHPGKMHLERREIGPHGKASHDQVLRQHPVGFDSNVSQQYDRVFFNFIQVQFIAVRVEMYPLFDGNFSGNPKPASYQLECFVKVPRTVIFPFVFSWPVFSRPAGGDMLSSTFPYPDRSGRRCVPGRLHPAQPGREMTGALTRFRKNRTSCRECPPQLLRAFLPPQRHLPPPASGFRSRVRQPSLSRQPFRDRVAALPNGADPAIDAEPVPAGSARIAPVSHGPETVPVPSAPRHRQGPRRQRRGRAVGPPPRS